MVTGCIEIKQRRTHSSGQAAAKVFASGRCLMNVLRDEERLDKLDKLMMWSFSVVSSHFALDATFLKPVLQLMQGS